jgi:hypothetical protein
MRTADRGMRIAAGGSWMVGAALVASATLVAQAPRPQPGVRLPLPQIESQMFHVSAGKRLKPAAWPNGARVAVGLSFDVDNATADLATGNLISESISRGEYGAVDREADRAHEVEAGRLVRDPRADRALREEQHPLVTQ